MGDQLESLKELVKERDELEKEIQLITIQLEPLINSSKFKNITSNVWRLWQTYGGSWGVSERRHWIR